MKKNLFLWKKSGFSEETCFYEKTGIFDKNNSFCWLKTSVFLKRTRFFWKKKPGFSDKNLGFSEKPGFSEKNQVFLKRTGFSEEKNQVFL